MKKYLNPQEGIKIQSTTCFTQNECEENVVRTEFTEQVPTDNADKVGRQMEIGKAVRGSMKFIKTDSGHGVVFRPFRVSAIAPAASEPLKTTDHGKVTQNSRYTRIVFEFARTASFENISDALDDEVWEVRQYLTSVQSAGCAESTLCFNATATSASPQQNSLSSVVDPKIGGRV